MNLNPTPTERLLLALLQLHPNTTEQELCTLAGSRAPKYTRAALRCLVLGGRVAETVSPTGNTYKVRE